MRIFTRLVASRFLLSSILLFSRGFSYTLQIACRKGRPSQKKIQEVLKFVFALDDQLYQLTSQVAICYEGGIHPKHRLTQYHEFFVKNVGKSERVLDIGCGIGAVAHDIALLSGAAEVVGIDMNQEQIDFAKNHYQEPNLSFIYGKAPEAIPEGQFDVVVLSNVLEHVENRVDFMRELVAKTKAQKYLIRVPHFERDWRLPLKKELGLNYFSDPSHYVEHTLEEFTSEIEAAGLKVHNNTVEMRWGEIWAVLEKRG